MEYMEMYKGFREASSLQELCDRLNEMEGLFEKSMVLGKLEEYYDLTELPVFGGPEPEDTNAIFSWDKDHVLMCDEWGPDPGKPWRIYLREECE